MRTELLISGLEALGLTPDPERIGKIQHLHQGLVRWNRVFNLTAVTDGDTFTTVHILDSLAIHPHLQGARILDVGTGAGFPGLPLAIFFPDRQFVLLDAVAKKLRFVRQMVLELGLRNVETIHKRVEDYVVQERFTTIVTRAFTETEEAYRLSHHLLVSGGRFLAMKGRYPKEAMETLADIPHRVIPITVPGLQAQRHLIEITRT